MFLFIMWGSGARSTGGIYDLHSVVHSIRGTRGLVNHTVDRWMAGRVHMIWGHSSDAFKCWKWSREVMYSKENRI